jgi:Tetracyclin repressor-like, C-terminal domain
MDAGEFAPADPTVVGRAVLHATARFHHPALAREWADPTTLARELDAVYSLILRGLLRGE